MIKTTCSTLPVPAKLKVKGKTSPVSERNYPKENSRVAYCVRCWIPTVKHFLWIRKPRCLILEIVPCQEDVLVVTLMAVPGCLSALWKTPERFWLPYKEEWASFRFGRKAIPSPGLQHTQDHPAVLEYKPASLLFCLQNTCFWQCTAAFEVSFAEPWVCWACCGVPGSPLALAEPPPAVLLPSSAGREQSCLSLLVTWERRNFLACTCLLCSSTGPGLKDIVVFAPYGGNK